MLEIIRSEDILQGIPVNWIGYTPPGGKGWQKLYTEEIVPVIAENRVKAEKTKKAISERARTAARIRELATDTIAKWSDLSDSISSSIGVDNVTRLAVAMRVNEIQTATRGLLGGLDSFVLVPNDLPESAEIDEDIRFFDAFTAYIDEDAELDKVLFALFTVPLKFRAKLLRAAGRMLSVVEVARETLRNSNSMVYKALKPRLDQITDVLDKEYAIVTPAIRKYKKEYAKSGLSALADLDKSLLQPKGVCAM